MAQKGPAKPRKKKEEVEKPQNAERWLLTYSDMITLIMVLFVVLYAESKVEVTKFNALAESLSSAFNMPGVQAREGQGGHSASPTDAVLTPPPGTGLAPKRSPKRDPFQEKAQSTLATEIRTGSIRMYTEARGIVLALAGDTFFKVGSADLEEGSIATLSKVAELLRGLPNPISVEGHSDNTLLLAAIPWAPTSCSPRPAPYRSPRRSSSSTSPKNGCPRPASATQSPRAPTTLRRAGPITGGSRYSSGSTRRASEASSMALARTSALQGFWMHAQMPASSFAIRVASSSACPVIRMALSPGLQARRSTRNWSPRCPGMNQSQMIRTTFPPSASVSAMTAFASSAPRAVSIA